MKTCQSLADFFLDRYQEKTALIRETSQQLLLEGVYLYKANRETNFVHVKIYNLLMVMRYMDYDRKDGSTSKGSYMEGSSDVIVQVEELFFLPAMKLILNEQSSAKPFLMVKYQMKKFEMYSVEDQGVISNLWEIIRRRAILYVSPSKVPPNTSLMMESTRNDASQLKSLSNIILDIMIDKQLSHHFLKLNFIFETSGITGFCLRPLEDELSAKKALQSKLVTTKELLVKALKLMEKIQAMGYCLTKFDPEYILVFNKKQMNTLIVKDITALSRDTGNYQLFISLLVTSIVGKDSDINGKYYAVVDRCVNYRDAVTMIDNF